MLEVAHAEFEGDREAAKASITHATRILRRTLERHQAFSKSDVGTGGLAGWQVQRLRPTSITSALCAQQITQHPAAGGGVVEVELINPAHDRQIPRRDRPGLLMEGAAAELQQSCYCVSGNAWLRPSTAWRSADALCWAHLIKNRRQASIPFLLKFKGLYLPSWCRRVFL
jgi:hypothetical protein